MPTIKDKIADIKRQFRYCRDNGKKAIAKGYTGDSWKDMAEAYYIALQILEEKGDWFPEEREKGYYDAHVSLACSWTEEQLKAKIKEEKENELRLSRKKWSYHNCKLSKIRLNAYEYDLFVREETKWLDNEYPFERRKNDCICRGAGACIQCNPSMFIKNISYF